MGSEYHIDRQIEDKRARLALQQRILDPATIRFLERVGVGEGWRCLEAGAGGGSIAEWLCRRVGPDGEVVATDLDTTFLDELGLDNLVVLRHDLGAEELPAAAFDLVHARDLLVHLPDLDAAIGKLAAAVKPGGWILLEEPDGSTVAPDPTAPEEARQLYSTVMGGIYAFLCDIGLHPFVGARLPGELRGLGFERVRSEARCFGYSGGPDADPSPHMLACRELMPRVVGTGRVTREHARRFLALIDDPSFSWREDLTVSTWGRRGAA